MPQAVSIVFDCLPFRMLGDAGVPLDASAEQQAMWGRLRAAMTKHGTTNTYFLYNADCTFQLTNTEAGYVRFIFEGTVRTDAEDARPIGAELASRLADTDFAKPLAPAVVEFFREAVRRAVLAEFQLFIGAGNLQRALAEREQVLRQWDANRGFVGVDI